MVQSRICNFLLDIDGVAYDATPLHLKPLSAGHLAQANVSSNAVVVRKDNFYKALPIGQSAMPCNILQTRCEFGWLFSKVSPAGDERFIMIYGEALTWLQNVVSNRASSMMLAMREINTIGDSEHNAETLTRLGSMDRHPSNGVVERRVLRRRRKKLKKKWRNLLAKCVQHKLGCVRMAATKPFEDTITGVINVTRSLMSFTYQAGFRKDFYDAVEAKVRVHDGFSSTHEIEPH